MAIVLTDDKHYKAIANAIRQCTNTPQTFKPEEMAAGVEEVQVISYSNGYYDGDFSGHNNGYIEGKKAFMTELIDACDANNGFYQYSFAGSGWNDSTFQPTKDINVISGAAHMFYNNKIVDLAGIFKNLGVKLNLSNCTGRTQQMFAYAYELQTVPFLDLRKVDPGYTMSSMFASCGKLHTIEGIHLPDDGIVTFGSTFSGCSALENLTFYGSIGSNGLSVNACTKLTHDSLMSIINALADKSTETGYTVTLGWQNLAKLTDEEKAIATERGWTLV